MPNIIQLDYKIIIVVGCNTCPYISSIGQECKLTGNSVTRKMFTIDPSCPLKTTTFNSVDIKADNDDDDIER